MGVRILHDARADEAVLFCSTSGWAFGPVFSEHEGHSADERAESFLRWLVIDPRSLDQTDLERKHSEWRSQEESQFKREQQTEEAEA